jgi:Cu-Zn family superoxide dismutase
MNSRNAPPPKGNVFSTGSYPASRVAGVQHAELWEFCMRPIKLALGLVATAAVAIAVTVVAPGSGSADPAAVSTPTAIATIRDATGATLGTLTLVQIQTNTVLVTANVSRLPAGFHGFHVHAVGLCDPNATDPTGTVVPFNSAGPHFNPGATTHGSHAGDLPPLLVVTSGSATVAVRTDRFTVNSLFDADGSAIIVHSGPDNLANIPTRYVSSTTSLPGPDAATLGTGDSGSRTGCGILRRA